MSLHSRPQTPDSPSSLRNATATIDDLTVALSDFSRAHSPEPSNISTCCCGRTDCETTKAWSAFKTKLESRLVLSAEVGQALLERHEAYVRRHELAPQGKDRSSSQTLSELRSIRTEEQVDARVAELVRENAVLEKRLSTALVNNEVAELSQQSALQELKQAKETISRLTTQNARLVGLDQRLNAAMQDKDDLRQERDSAVQRARLAETRLLSLKEKCGALQAQVSRLRDDIDMQRIHRQELSEELLNEARERLQQLQQVQLGHEAVGEDEIMKVLESLVADNEALKHDYAEVQNILSETREDLRVLQDELEERRANDTVPSKHRHTESMTSTGSAPLSPTFNVGTAPTPSALHTVFLNSGGPSRGRRAASAERSPRRPFEPLTPETGRRSWSPDPFLTTETKNAFLSQPRSSYTPSQLSFEVDDASIRDNQPTSPEKPRGHKSLHMLTRSRGVQTDGTGSSNPLLAPSVFPRALTDLQSISTPRDGLSESSSITDGHSSVLSALIDRMSVLGNRLMQADALTLTNRLKRQHLVGADVGHLSRSTVNSVLQELIALRSQYRAFLEDEKVTTTCNRKDLRGLFKLFKDVFSELGQLRVTLNDVILDPTVAGKIREMALHPSKADVQSSNVGNGGTAASGSSGWIAPLTKLLGLPGGSSNEEPTAPARGLSPPARPSSRGRGRPPPRIVPKREAALSATSMTVNVEFSGAGVGRAVTSTRSADTADPLHASTSTSQVSGQLRNAASRSVMNIFAGAPRPAANPADPWVVIPKPLRGPSRLTDLSGSATIGRSATRNLTVDGSSQLGNRGHPTGSKRLSRIVDAVIDRDPSQQSFSPTKITRDGSNEPTDEERDIVQDTLFERTLRPRGLSDSSIHTTFMTHGEREESQRQPEPTTITRQSVLQALSRRVQSFRLASSSIAASIPAPSVSTVIASAISRPHTPQITPPNEEDKPTVTTHTTSPVPMPESRQRAISPGGGLFTSMNLSGWAANAATLEEDPGPSIAGLPQHFYAGSPRDERYGGSRWTREREL